MELRYCSEALTNPIEVIIAVRPLSVRQAEADRDVRQRVRCAYSALDCRHKASPPPREITKQLERYPEFETPLRRELNGTNYFSVMVQTPPQSAGGGVSR